MQRQVEPVLLIARTRSEQVSQRRAPPDVPVASRPELSPILGLLWFGSGPLLRQLGREELERESEVEAVALAQLDLEGGETLQQASVVEPAGVDGSQPGGLHKC